MRLVIGRYVKTCGLAALALACAALPGAATEVTLTVPGASKKFNERVQAGSLSVSTAAQADATAQDMLAAARADYGRLVGVLYGEGYYSIDINIRVDGQEAADIPALRAPDRIERIDITIDRGEGFFFGKARVAPIPPGTELPEKFATGELAKGDRIFAATRTGIDAWRDAGHAKAEVAEQSIIADHARHTLDAEITLAPGPRLRFGTLLIDNSAAPSRVREGRIREIAGLPTGETFSPEEQQDAANRLRRTGAFRSVVMREAAEPNPDGTLDMETTVVDAKRRRIGAGAELSSLEGITVSGFWLHRNLLGGAERLRIDALVGGIGGDSGGVDFRLGARIDRPATFTPDTGAFLLANIEDNDEPDYKERKVEIGGGLTHIFSDKLTGEIGLTYRYSEIIDDLGERELQHLLFPARLTWDARDDVLNPTEGLYADLSITPFIGLDEGGSLGSRVFADIRDYLTFGKADRVTLAGRAQFGSVAGAGISEVPADMLFYSGGAGTVRGQRYQSLGVTLPSGAEIGGRSFMGFSGEIRTMVARDIQAVAFADTGFVGEEALGSGSGEWHSGAGLGGRYFTAVGPVRVDLATPLDSDVGTEYELYIGIGQAF